MAKEKKAPKNSYRVVGEKNWHKMTKGSDKPKKEAPSKRYDSFSDMMAYEEGTASEGQVKKLFQHLVDTGQAWQLQGSYGRAASDMLQSGFIHPPKKEHNDSYSNKVKPGYKGRPSKSVIWEE